GRTNRNGNQSAESNPSAAGRSGACAAGKLTEAVAGAACRRVRHSGHKRLRGVRDIPLVVQAKERLVFPHRTAERPTKLVPVARRNGGSIEEVARVERAVAV